MKHVRAAVLCIAMPIATFASENGYKVTYDGGSLPDAKAGTGMKIYIETNQVRFTKDKADVVTIPASAITEISYGQDVHRRIDQCAYPQGEHADRNRGVSFEVSRSRSGATECLVGSWAAC
jgi:hypothetical protein